MTLPEGKYTVNSRREKETRTFLPAGKYLVDLRAGRSFDFEVSKLQSPNGEVRIRVSARGVGRHRFRLRTDNLTVSKVEKEISLQKGTQAAVEWQGRIGASDSPWVAVVIADENPTRRKELMGGAWER